MQILEKDISTKLETLPASSAAVTKLISIIDNPATTRDQVLHLLALDQVLFANAFKYANSAALGNCRRLESLTEIVDVLGFNVLKSIAVLTALYNVSTNNELWFNGIFTAVAAKKIAEEIGKSPEFGENVFMAAMLQQYGLFALIHFSSDKYKEVDTELSFYDRLKQETQIYGYNHLELSTKVLDSWGLPKKIISIISNQESKTDKKLKEHNLIIDLARVILETGPLEDQEDLDCFTKTHEALLKELKLEINLKYIDGIFTDARDLVVI